MKIDLDKLEFKHQMMLLEDHLEGWIDAMKEANQQSNKTQFGGCFWFDYTNPPLMNRFNQILEETTFVHRWTVLTSTWKPKSWKTGVCPVIVLMAELDGDHLIDDEEIKEVQMEYLKQYMETKTKEIEAES